MMWTLTLAPYEYFKAETWIFDAACEIHSAYTLCHSAGPLRLPMQLPFLIYCGKYISVGLQMIKDGQVKSFTVMPSTNNFRH